MGLKILEMTVFSIVLGDKLEVHLAFLKDLAAEFSCIEVEQRLIFGLFHVYPITAVYTIGAFVQIRRNIAKTYTTELTH